MLGAIVGDIAGSVYEGRSWQGGSYDFPLFTKRSHCTDDTAMTAAVAEALMDAADDDERFREKLIDRMHEYGERYPHGYGKQFKQWLLSGDRKPYNSWGNGSAMRVSPVGWAFNTLEDVERKAAISAAVTHNHPEGVKGAQAVAGAIFLARKGHGKDEIKKYITEKYGYNLDRSLEEVGKTCQFSTACQTSVPEAIIAFLESRDYLGAIKNAIWLGCDADTQAAIAGSIAEAFYGCVPDYLLVEAGGRMNYPLRELAARWHAWLQKRNG